MEHQQLSIKKNWQQHWQDKAFRRSFTIAFLLLVIVLAQYPFFFLYIENRKGIQLNDFILNQLPSINLSVPIFILIWLNVLLLLITVIKKPKFALLFLWSYLLMNLLRIITMLAVPLDPPQNLIVLMDPISNRFYGKTYITKDLFFSGHTATMFLIYLCFSDKMLKTIALIISIAVGVMVMIQKVHYAFDVLAAFPFAYLAYYLAKKVVKNKLGLK